MHLWSVAALAPGTSVHLLTAVVKGRSLWQIRLDTPDKFRWLFFTVESYLGANCPHEMNSVLQGKPVGAVGG